jgi:hypothetical protein
MALFLGRGRRGPSRAKRSSATERTTSGEATDERTRTWPRRLVLSVWRWLIWPARIVWAGAGHAARALSVAGDGVRWLVRQVAPFADAPLAVLRRRPVGA